MRRRIGVPKEREDLLNSIDFKWVAGVVNNRSWEEKYVDFLKQIDEFGNINILTRVDGTSNPLYTWLINQKKQSLKVS